MTNTKQTRALLDFVERYGPQAGEQGPVLFVEEVFGAKPDQWQRNILRAVGRGERLIAVRSCHGPGKTCLAAWLVWYHLLTRFPQKTVATAPTSSQLKGALLPEIKMWGQKLAPSLQDLFEVKAEGIYLRSAESASFFEARTSRAESPEAMQGVHSDHVLLIGDEASGIPEAVYNAASGSMSDEHATTLLIGNPVRTSGRFFDAFHKNSDMWYTTKVGHMDSPRVTDEFVEMIRRQHGEDSAEFRIRCLGEFPKADDDTVIPFSYVEMARGRDVVDKPGARKVWGLDVARFGSDRSALCERTARTARILDVWGQKDLMQTAGRVKARWDGLPPSQRPSSILVDDIGLGSGVLDRLRELGLPARGINVAESAAMNEKFVRARSELWWKAREWLEGHNVCLSEPETDAKEDPQRILASELVVPKYQYTSTGKIQVESKESMKKREHKSPDVADSFVLTFAEDLTTATFGSKGSNSWNELLKRDLAVV